MIDIRNPQMGLVVKMKHNGPHMSCSLSVSVVCDSYQVHVVMLMKEVRDNIRG